MELLLYYNYIILYQPRNRNKAADALSRRAELVPENLVEDHPTTMIPPLKFVEIAMEIAQLDEQELMECMIAIIREAVKSNDQIQELIRNAVNLNNIPDDVMMVDGLPYQDTTIFIPDNTEIKRQILQLHHDMLMAGHLGQTGMLELVQRTYWWKNMAKYVREYIQGCHTCGRNKHQNWQPEGVMRPLPIPDR